MAHNILHRRSNLAGKLPDTASLLVGEIGINTYDGKAYLHKSASVESIQQFVITDSITTGSISITGTGSFGEINVTNDFNISGSIFVNGDVVGLGDVDFQGSVTASYFVGDGSQLTNVIVSAANNYDFNDVPSSGLVGYLENSGSNVYRVQPTENEISLKYNGTEFASFDVTNGYSGSLYGIGSIVQFSGSLATRLQNLESSASVLDAGTF